MSIWRSSILIRRGLLLGRTNRYLSTATYPDVQKPSSKNGINFDFLKEIAEEASKGGRRFLLPVADSDAMQRILDNLIQITDEGNLTAKSLKEILSSNPDLFPLVTKNGSDLFKTALALVDFCGLTFENAMRFIAENLEYIDVSKHKNMGDCLNILAGLGFSSGSRLGNIIFKCPALLYGITSNQISQTYENLAMFFPKKSLHEQLIPHAPHILLKPFEEVELKYEFIYFHMGIEPDKLAMSFEWIEMELDEIIMRNNFLRKVGKYITPDPKKPQYEMKNPPAFRIFDTDNLAFATEVACVTVEEWIVFQQVFKKLKENETKDQPYERIKPSIRKKFERRIKEAQEYEDYYIEHI